MAELPALEGDFPDADHATEHEVHTTHDTHTRQYADVYDAPSQEDRSEKPPAREAAADEGNSVQAEGGAKRPSQPPLSRPTQGARAPPPQSGGATAGGGRVNSGGSLRPPPPRAWGHQHQSAPPSAPSSPIDPVLMEVRPFTVLCVSCVCRGGGVRRSHAFLLRVTRRTTSPIFERPCCCRMPPLGARVHGKQNYN